MHTWAQTNTKVHLYDGRSRKIKKHDFFRVICEQNMCFNKLFVISHNIHLNILIWNAFLCIYSKLFKYYTPQVWKQKKHSSSKCIEHLPANKVIRYSGNPKFQVNRILIWTKTKIVGCTMFLFRCLSKYVTRILVTFIAPGNVIHKNGSMYHTLLFYVTCSIISLQTSKMLLLYFCRKYGSTQQTFLPCKQKILTSKRTRR